MFRLRRYYPDEASTAAPQMLLVPPLMLAAEIYDVSPTSSAVGTLHENAVAPWVIDFGAPERERGGLERTLADHVLAVSDAIDRVREHTGRDAHLAGYSQGGMFCYQAAAYRRNEGLASLVTFGSPVDTRLGMPLGLPEQVAVELAEVIAFAFRGGGVPPWFSRYGFRLLDPVKSVRNRLEFLLQLHDREALLPRERQRRFLEGRGLGGLARAGSGGVREAVRGLEPDARGRVRDRRPAAQPGRPRPSDPGRRGERGRDRPGGGRARDPPGGAASGRLRAVPERRSLRSGGGHLGPGGDVADRGRVDPLAGRRRGDAREPDPGSRRRDHGADTTGSQPRRLRRRIGRGRGGRDRSRRR